jgi:hypothetical protein
MASALLLSAGSDYIGGETLFQLQEKPIISYTSKTIQVPFQSKQLKFGDLAYATLPKRDDLIKSVTLKSTLGSLYPVSANGYVYTSNISNADYYDYGGTLRLRINNVYGFYNTQLLNNWAQPITNGLAVPSVVDGKFSFQAVAGAQFYTEQAAAFWGFDIRYATSSNPWKFTSNIPQMNLIQSGWISGFIPPPQNFTYYDSVGYLLPRLSTLYIGGQTIQTINSKTLYTETDLEVPLANQAGLTILVGKNDAASQSVSRDYWTTLTFDEIPISQIALQDVQISVQFENFNNLTARTANGGILNGSAYTQYPITLPLQNIQNILTYNGLITLFGQYNANEYITIYSEATSTAVQSLTLTNAVAPSIAFDKYYYISNTSYLTQYSISSTGISNPQTSNVNINYGSGYVGQTLAVGKYLFILYDDLPVAYDTTLSLNSSSSYTHLSITVTSYLNSIGSGTVYNIFTTLALSTGKNIYYPVLAQSNSYIFYMTINDFVAGHSYAYHTVPLSNTLVYSFIGGSGRSVSDGTYIYYPFETNNDTGLTYMYRLNTMGNTIEMYPAFVSPSDALACPQIFDGVYVYYYEGEGDHVTYRFYNTTMKFTDPNAWSFLKVYTDGSTVSTNGTTTKAYSPVGQSGYMVLGSLYNYNFITDPSATYAVKIDPYVIVPSLTASLIVEYAKLMRPKPYSNSLIRQTQMNTFTMRAGISQNQFTFTFTGPIREFWFKTSASIARLQILLNGVILADEDYNSINILRPFETHAITPYQTTGIYSISIDPNSMIPSGSLNISRIRMATIQVYFSQAYTTDQTIYMFARSMNVLQCKDGIGGLLFN